MAKRKPRRPSKVDPSRTTLLRRAFIIDLRSRFERLRRAVVELIYKEDVFGLKPREPLSLNAPADRKAWEFHTSDDKLKAFNRWFKLQVDNGILEVDRSTKPWLAKYVESAYKKGAIRAYMDVHRPDFSKTLDFYKGSQEQFLRSSFETAERTSKVSMLGTRTYEELKGITSSMSQRMSRVLADGIANGKGPYDIARTMSRTITGITRTRANVLARTEIIHAHAEGQLDAFEDLDVDEVGVEAEWSTANDEDVCPLCAALEGTVLTIEQARGLLPRHPNCRCAWIPKLNDTSTSARTKRSISKSIKAERPGRLLRDAKRLSTWLGKERVK